MAVFQKLREFFASSEVADDAEVVPAPPTEYEIRPLTEKHLKELIRLNMRCFKRGENYTKHTFSFLLGDPNTLSYRAATLDDTTVGFIFIMNSAGVGHITTIGVAPEHRRRGIALKLLAKAEESLLTRGFATVSLEVRVSNVAAQSLYRRLGYSIVQRLGAYYNNGEDAFMMVKSLS